MLFIYYLFQLAGDRSVDGVKKKPKFIIFEDGFRAVRKSIVKIINNGEYSRLSQTESFKPGKNLTLIKKLVRENERIEVLIMNNMERLYNYNCDDSYDDDGNTNADNDDYDFTFEGDVADADNA